MEIANIINLIIIIIIIMEKTEAGLERPLYVSEK